MSTAAPDFGEYASAHDAGRHPLPIRMRPLAQAVGTPPWPAARPGRSTRVDASAATAGNASGRRSGTSRRARLRLVDDFGPTHTDLSALPDAELWVRGVAVALYEAATGARPATQVMRWLAPDVHDSIVRRSGRAARRGGATRRPVRLRRVLVTVLPGHVSVVEASAVIDDHHRVRAMALRLEGLDGRWLVTACEIG